MEIPASVTNLLNSEIDPLLTEGMSEKEKVNVAEEKGDSLVICLKIALEQKLKSLQS